MKSQVQAEFAEAALHVASVGEAADLLRPKTRRTIAAAVAAWPLAANRAATRAKWAALVDEATRRLRTLGIVEIHHGGAPALARQLIDSDRPEGGFLRSLDHWEQRGLIKRYYGEKTTHHPPLIAVQIPLLTETLLWTAHRVAERISPQGQTYTLPVKDVVRIAALSVGRMEVPRPLDPSQDWIGWLMPPDVPPVDPSALHAARAWVRDYQRTAQPSPTDRFLSDMSVRVRSDRTLTAAQAHRLVKLHVARTSR